MLLLILCGLLVTPAGQAAPAAVPARTYQLALDTPLVLSDGTRLSASVFRPIRSGRYPVIFVVTPYTADRWVSWGAFFASNHYIFACVDARGRGNSGGAFEPWINEGRDGDELVSILSKLPGSDGRVVGWGGSYSGKNQWAFAVRRNPALKAIEPAATGYPGFDLAMVRNVPTPTIMRWLAYVSGKSLNANLNRDEGYWTALYGALSRGEIAYRDFDRAAGFPSPIWKAWADHPDVDSFWKRGTPSDGELASIDIPVLAVTGTYDDAQAGTLRYWQAYQGTGAPKAKGYLIIGPWDHPGTREPQLTLGGLAFGKQSKLDIKALNLGFYDWVLKGRAKPALLADHVLYYVAGADRWDSAPTLEAATARRETLFLSSPSGEPDRVTRAGQLAAVPPRLDEDRFTDDPAKGPYNEGPEGGAGAGPDYLADPRSIERLAGDGLIYDTPPFLSPADLVGRPEALLRIALDVPDADLRLQLYEVRADGSVVFLGQDQIRARYRNRPERAELIAGPEPQDYRFDRFPFIAREIAPQSRLRLVLSPLSASIYQQRNRHSGKPVADETRADNRLATVRLILGPGASRLIVPYGRAQARGGPERGR